MVNIHEPGPFEGRAERWPILAVSGAMEVRLAETEAEVEAAQGLRYRVFYEEMSAIPTPDMCAQRRDFDRLDEFCDHMLVIDRARLGEDGQPLVVGTYRMMREAYLARSGGFYTSGEYDLSPMLAAWPKQTRYLELGRSCILKEYRSRNSTMQLLWRGLMAYVARFSSELMFGCASFAGVDPKALALPLSYLHHNHLMPAAVRVRARPELYVEMNVMPKEAIDAKEALRALPAMIKGYLRAGCTVGEGAVIDHQFGTTDVFIYLPMKDADPRYVSRFSQGVA
ncbi:MAG TPA: GNAT family N-acyltransferase [Rhizomicrobium sp.]|nr:GNAT family N-acyltransferase [Rhizomicrobium sp.]